MMTCNFERKLSENGFKTSQETEVPLDGDRTSFEVDEEGRIDQQYQKPQ